MQFNQLDIKSEIKKAIDDLSYTELTPIQESTFSLISEGKDILGEAPTGTGKTAAYAIPLLNKVDLGKGNPKILVLVPTRELAIQSVAEIEKYSTYLEGVVTLSIYGGQPINRQLNALKKNPQIIVSTPGRLLDHIKKRSIVLDDISYVVLDECDEMLNMGFRPDINKILSLIHQEYQSILFSATISKEIKEISKKYQKDAVYIKTKRNMDFLKNIEQYYLVCKEDKKMERLVDVIQTSIFKKMFVFARTKRKVSKINKYLLGLGIDSTCIHGDLRQNARDTAMNSFRDGSSNVMIATDIAARGLDITDVDFVINFDLPEEDEFYVHRIGRTGRASAKGKSLVFLGSSKKSILKLYEGMTNDKIEEYILPTGKEKEIMGAKISLTKAKELTKEANLKDYKELIEETLASWQEESSEIDLLTLTAALLKETVAVDRAQAYAEVKTKRESDSKKSSRSKSSDKEEKRDLGYFVLPSEETEEKEEVEETEEKPYLPKAKKERVDSQRFFINLGQFDGLNETDLKDFIVDNTTGVSSKDFIDVYVKDKFSFFELPKDRTDKVMADFGDVSFGERKVSVELSAPKDHTRRSSSFGDRRDGYRSAPRREYGSRREYGRSSERRDSGSRDYNRYGSDRRSYRGDSEKKEYGGERKRSYAPRGEGRSYSRSSDSRSRSSDSRSRRK